jgi:hypothetical protein
MELIKNTHIMLNISNLYKYHIVGFNDMIQGKSIDIE